MSEAFINAISEGHKDEVIKWLQQIYSENEQLRHDITRHVQICAEQANEIVELRNKLEQAEARCRLLQAVADEAHSKLREYVRMQGVMVDGRVPPSWRKLADALAATATAPKSSKPE